MTQQNAALVEQSAAAAQSLKDQAARLSQVVSTFRIDGSSAAVVRTPERAEPVMAARPAVKAPAAVPVAKAQAPARSAAPAQPKPAPVAKPVSVPVSTEGDWESF
jgi:hypothetical protein